MVATNNLPKIINFPSKNVPVAADSFLIQDSTDSNNPTQLTFANLAAALAVPVIEDITHADLTTAIANSTLAPQTKYRITDFQTIHMIAGSTDINTAPVEPLIVTALKVNEVSKHAIQEAYVSDYLEYDVADVLCEDGSTPRPGKITFRKDMAYNVSFYYDRRNYLTRRFQIIQNGSYNYDALKVYNAGEFALYNSTGLYVCHLTPGVAGMTPDSDTQYRTLISNTLGINPYIFTLNTQFLSGALSLDLTTSQDYKTFHTTVGTNISGDLGTIDNVFLGGATDVKMGKDNINNIFGVNCVSNIIGSGCYSNYIGVDCNYNELKNYCYQNLLQDNSDGNIIGDSSNNNLISWGAGRNTLGDLCVNNTFVQGCIWNILDDECEWNVFWPDNLGNLFDRVCNYNIFHANCGKNKFDSGSARNKFLDGAVNNTLHWASTNVVGINFTGNEIGYNSNTNTFWDNCSYNFFGELCETNTFGDDLLNNTFWNVCQENIIWNLFRNNIAQNNFSLNTIGYSCNANKFGQSCARNTIAAGFEYNTLGAATIYNVFGDNCLYNVLGANSEYNTFGTSCNNNTIGNEAKNNTFGNSFGMDLANMLWIGNTIGNGFKNNIVGEQSFGNTIGAHCTNNLFSGELLVTYTIQNGTTLGLPGDVITCANGSAGIIVSDNGTVVSIKNVTGLLGFVVGQSVSSTLGDGAIDSIAATPMPVALFTNNVIANNCMSNYFGMSCDKNTIESDVKQCYFDGSAYNSYIGKGTYKLTAKGTFNWNRINFANEVIFWADAINNDVVDSISFVDLTTATHIYGTYNCNISTRFDGVSRLRYLDSGDNYVIVDVTA